MISVIIPFYNTSKYLKQCLESITSQSYMDIEVIAVNDGSTDNSEKICSNYDVKLINIEHSGLSAARNKGLAEAKGEWIMFLDSDDWVDKDFCRIPLDAAIKNNADIVAFMHIDVNEEGHQIPDSYAKIRPFGAVNKEQAIDYGEIVVWNKIYKRELFDELKFDEGRVFEDLLITHRIIYKSRKTVLLPNRLYYCRHRKDSLSRQKNKQYKTDAFEAYLIRCNDLISYGYPETKAKKSLLSPAFGHCALTNEGDAFHKEAEEITNSIKGIPEDFPLKKKILLIIWKANKRLFHLICRLAKVKL